MQREATSWAAAEFKDIDLGDQRLNKRAVLLVLLCHKCAIL
ncbi:hypothetical protein KAF44_27325 (plasmid) [Cupriavidus necator]|nr:hypothetical protein KAF44_24585 [Cupriavidus necator]UIF88944.1 hypothetical protein KAF44_27325 [Cupriavidus necator]